MSSFVATSTNSANFTKPPTESNNNVQTTINNNHFNHQQQSVSHQQIFSNFIAGQHQPPPLRNTSIMPKNEPVKLVYPQNNNNNNVQSSTIVTMNNNRVTFSNAPVQNGTITLSPMQANQLTQQGQQQQVMQGANIKITGQGGQQLTPSLIFKNTISSAPGTFVTSSPVTMSKANNNQVRIIESDSRVAMTAISVFIFSRCVARRARCNWRQLQNTHRNPDFGTF